MKAIVQDRFGTADVLEFRDIPEPVPGPSQMRVEVRAAGAGPDVWHLMTGKPYLVRAMPGFRKMNAGVRGRDVAGVVESVGANVTDLQPGDEVMGIAEGSFAELAVGDADMFVRKPSRLSFEQAAAAPISGITALMAVRDVGEVQHGQRVLVVGAGGGVGSLVVQVAKAFGAASVTGVASGGKADLVRSIGADEVIDYTRESFTDGTRRWDVVIDTAGRRPLRELRRALESKGTLAIVGGDGGGNWTGGFMRQVLRAPLLSMFVSQRLRPVMTKEDPADLRALAELMEQGKVTPVVGTTFALPDAAEAMRYLERGHAAGKVVITV